LWMCYFLNADWHIGHDQPFASINQAQGTFLLCLSLPCCDFCTINLRNLIIYNRLPFPRVLVLMPSPRAQVSSRMKSCFLATNSKRTMTQMLTFLPAPRKQGLVPSGSPHYGFATVFDTVSAAYLVLCNCLLLVFNLSVVCSSCQSQVLGACSAMMKMMIFSALPRPNLWYQTFVLRTGEHGKGK
jgi:hypothetical protein